MGIKYYLHSAHSVSLGEHSRLIQLLLLQKTSILAFPTYHICSLYEVKRGWAPMSSGSNSSERQRKPQRRWGKWTKRRRPVYPFCSGSNQVAWATLLLFPIVQFQKGADHLVQLLILYTPQTLRRLKLDEPLQRARIVRELRFWLWACANEVHSCDNKMSLEWKLNRYFWSVYKCQRHKKKQAFLKLSRN